MYKHKCYFSPLEMLLLLICGLIPEQLQNCSSSIAFLTFHFLTNSVLERDVTRERVKLSILIISRQRLVTQKYIYATIFIDNVK